MKLFNKLAIIGVGLIGGSIALAIKKKKLAKEIVGVSRHQKTLLLASKKGAIDKGSRDLSIIKDADLVILATPVNTILNLAPQVSKFIGPDCIVTDVGSTKEEIVSRLGEIFPRYVGSHPLAGSEKQGIINASSHIFKDSLCILTPTKSTNPQALKKVKEMWNQLDVKAVLLTPKMHDKILSLVSHLCHIVAFCLIGSIPNKYLGLAPNSLKEITRIAASDNRLWKDIFLSNQKNILSSIELFQKKLSRMKSVIRKKDKEILMRILRQAKDKRISLEKSKIQILPNPK